MTSPLDNLAGSGGSLQKEPPDGAEFLGLVRSAKVRLTDAQNAENSLESRFDLAYNAAHAYCLAALRHAGYRSQNRYLVFQALPHTLQLARKSGESLRNATRSATKANTKAILTSMTN